jgi:hypothetical protein
MDYIVGHECFFQNTFYFIILLSSCHSTQYCLKYWRNRKYVREGTADNVCAMDSWLLCHFSWCTPEFSVLCYLPCRSTVFTNVMATVQFAVSGVLPGCIQHSILRTVLICKGIHLSFLTNGECRSYSYETFDSYVPHRTFSLCYV